MSQLWSAFRQELLLLYFVQLITIYYLLKKNANKSFYILIILLFYPAIFSAMGKNFQDGYRIITLIYTLWICNEKRVFARFKKGDGLLTFLFILYSLFYAISAYQNNDSWTIILSQFSRYIIAYCLWFLVRNELTSSVQNVEVFKRFTYDIILMQIVITIGKLFVFQGPIESIVGSISHEGGAPGTTIPILGFIVLWFYNQGKFDKWDWLFVVGLMMIGFLAGKRAVWFIMPLVIASFMIYVPKLKVNNTLWMAIIMAPLAFYLGVRLTPNMNPENQVWGSFDYDYAFDFAEKYQFGDKTKGDQSKVQGRGGATMALWDRWNSDEQLNSGDWLGIGLTSMFATDYGEFSKSGSQIKLNHKGSATGVFQTYVSTGFIGIFTTILFFFTMLWQIKMNRIRWVIIAIAAWEYFMYTGTIFRTPAFMFLIVYFVHYSNYLKQRKPKIQQSSLFIPNQNQNNGSLAKSPYYQNQ